MNIKNISKGSAKNKHTHNPSLPPGWRWMRLGKVCKVITGNTPSRQRPEFFGDGIPWLTPRDIGETMHVYDGQEKVTELGINSGRARILDKGTVLLVCIGATIGKVAIAGRNLCVNQQINALVCGDEVHPEFLYYTLMFHRQQIIDLASTATLPIINQTVLKNYAISFPPLPEQKRIAAKIQELMQEVERAQTACQKQLEAAKVLPAAYLRQVFESEEAKKWERRKLGEVCDYDSGIWGNEPDGSSKCYPVLRSNNIRDGKMIFDEIAIRKVKSKYLATKSLNFGDVLVTTSSGSKNLLGKSAIFTPPNDKIYLFSNFTMRLRHKPEIIDCFFLYFYLQSPAEKRVLQLIQDTTTGLRNLDRKEFLNQLIPLPSSLKVQHCIAAEFKQKMSQVESLQSAIRNQQSTLNALPQAILRKAFRGEL